MKCLCGCGEKANTKRGYKRGHGEQYLRSKTAKTCKCGCGEKPNPKNQYVNGHQQKCVSEETKEKMSKAHIGHVPSNKLPVTDPVLCACGCGEFAKPKNRYITGHNAKGRTVSLKTRWKLSKAKAKHNPGGWINLHPYKSTVQFEKLRDAVLERDGNRCIFHNKYCDGQIGAHHVVPIVIGKDSPLCDDMANMLTICNHHHGIIEPKGRNGGNRKWKKFLPAAFKYLKKFKYSKMLLTDYTEKA